jgi:hypothetical protein
MGGAAGSQVIDAGVDTGPPDTRKLPIHCGNVTCNAVTHFCCLDDVPSCVPLGTDGCRSNRDRLHCDDSSDCDNDQVCCVIDANNGAPNDAVCRSGCAPLIAGRRAQILCNPTDPACPAFDQLCTANGMSLLAGYPYCH